MISKNKGLIIKLSALLVVLVATVLLFSGCLGGGSRALGWSGVAISGENIFFGSMEGKLIALNSVNGNPKWQLPLESNVAGSGGGCAGAGHL